MSAEGDEIDHYAQLETQIQTYSIPPTYLPPYRDPESQGHSFVLAAARAIASRTKQRLTRRRSSKILLITISLLLLFQSIQRVFGRSAVSRNISFTDRYLNVVQVLSPDDGENNWKEVHRGVSMHNCVQGEQWVSTKNRKTDRLAIPIDVFLQVPTFIRLALFRRGADQKGTLMYLLPKARG